MILSLFDLVVADICAEIVINRAIKNAFPDDCIIGEEDATEVTDELFINISKYLSLNDKKSISDALHSPTPNDELARYWAVDPIDGTKGFIRGDQYAICIALVDGKTQKTTIAAMGCPNLEGGIVLIAVRGQGIFKAKLGDSFDALEKVPRYPLQASLESAQITCAFESSHTKSTEIADLAQAVNNQVPLIKMDSQCKYAMLALNLAQMYYRRHASNNPICLSSPKYKEAIWDNAPGVLFVEEAGGQVTDFQGNHLLFPPSRHFYVVGGIFASTLEPHLHSQVLEKIRAILG